MTGRDNTSHDWNTSDTFTWCNKCGGLADDMDPNKACEGAGITQSHTPTTEAVRNAYIWAMRNAHVASSGEAGAEFDRWLRQDMDRKLDEKAEDLNAVVASAAELMDDEAIGPWLDRKSNMLGDTPRQLIKRGNAGRVLDLLEALKDGVVW